MPMRLPFAPVTKLNLKRIQHPVRESGRRQRKESLPRRPLAGGSNVEGGPPSNQAATALLTSCLEFFLPRPAPFSPLGDPGQGHCWCPLSCPFSQSFR